MSVSLGQRCLAACILGLGLCLASSAQEKADKQEKKFPSATDVAELLKKEPITLETWMVWRGRLLDWISDRGKGTDPAFEAGRKFARTQANDKEEMNAPVARDALAWYLLGGAYYEEVETKPTQEQMAGFKRADKALRQSIKLDDKFAYAHRKLATVLLAEEDIDPGEEKDLTKMTPRLAEAAKELDEAARLEPKIDIGELRHNLGKLLAKQDRYAPANAQLNQALKEEAAPNTALLADLGMAILRNPELKTYAATLNSLKDLQDKYPTEPVIPFIRGLTYVEAGQADKAQEAFNAGWAMKADPTKLIPIKEIYDMVYKIIRNEKTSWPMSANQLGVLALNWSDDPNIAAAHAFVCYKAEDYDTAASEIARIRKMGQKPELVIQNFLGSLRVSGQVVPEIEFQGRRSRLTTPFFWMVMAIAALYSISVMVMIAFTPRPVRARQSGEPPIRRARWLTPGHVLGLVVVSLIVGAIIQNVFGVSLYLGFADAFIIVGIAAALRHVYYSRGTGKLVWPEEPPVLLAPYKMAMFAGIGLYFAALLFMFTGLVLLVGGLIFLLLTSPTLSLMLLIQLFAVGLLAWLFLAMLMARPAKEKQGIVVDSADITRLRQTIDEVTRKLDTEPIQEIRLTTGSAVTVTMLARRPLALLKKSKPALVIGYTAFRLLNSAELQALVAQQIAPLSRRDDGQGRAIYCSWLTMTNLLEDWQRQNAGIGFINPFYFLLAGYFWVFNRLTVPFIRGRLAQADQTAAKLNGSAVLESAMLKAQADGPLFQERLEELVEQLLAEEPDDLGNMYAAWDELCADPTTPPQQGSDVQPASMLREMNFALLAVGPRERNQARRWALDFKGPTPYGLPTLGQRISTLPARLKGKKESGTDITTGEAIRRDDSKPPATELLDNVEGIEEKLTEFYVPTPTPASAEKPAEAEAPVK